MRAIDADALIEKCGDWYVEEGTESGFIGTLENLLATQPTIQPEIIRCKDCKHNPNLSLFGCPMSHLSNAQRPETAWCWKAERREVKT